MSVEKHVGVIVIFAVGIVVTIISIMRLVETVGFNNTDNPSRTFYLLLLIPSAHPLPSPKDFVPVGIWSLLEFDVVILCACMPAIRALFIRFLKKPTPINADSYGSYNRYNYKDSGTAAGSGSGVCDRYFQSLASKSHPDGNKGEGAGVMLEQVFTWLEEVEKGEDQGRDRWVLQESQKAGNARAHSAAHLVRKESH
ncbi:hypothetical protein BDV12DRAFT_196839 [Aspergillus spectabilis]